MYDFLISLTLLTLEFKLFSKILNTVLQLDVHESLFFVQSALRIAYTVRRNGAGGMENDCEGDERGKDFSTLLLLSPPQSFPSSPSQFSSVLIGQKLDI